MIAGYSIWKIVIICIGVFVAGTIDAIGGGGGLITVPVYLMAGLPTHYALGTNKMSSCLGTIASTLRYIKNGFVNWKLAIPSIILAITGAHFGTTFQLMVDDKYLKYILIFVLMAVAIVMIKKKELPETAGDIDSKKQCAIVWALSFTIGMYDGFYGPGTGTFLLIAFCRLAKMDVKTASGNVKVVNLSSNIGGFLTSLTAGKVIVPIGFIAAVFSFLGHYIGAGLLIKKGTKIVTPVILLVLTIFIIKIMVEIV